MAVTLGGGKIIISDKAITIKEILGSTVIQKNLIKGLESEGSMLLAIWNTIILIGIYKAFHMYRGKKLTTIKTRFDEEHTFWLTPEDYLTLQENL